MKTLRKSRLIRPVLALLFAVGATSTPAAQAECVGRAYTEPFIPLVGPAITAGQCSYACDGSANCWGDTSGLGTARSIVFHEFCGPCDPE